MPTSTFFVSGDPERARTTIHDLLTRMGFTLQYSGPFNGVAERGSKGATIAAGALAGSNQHLRVKLALAQDPNGNTAITLASDTTGMAAGLIGVRRASKAYNELFASVRGTFQQAGVLLGESQA
ncbi:MAG: hypothetical protein LBS27_09495 [Bifidobacteriaceae bacterium]|jgi:hypothetical protein|nr:hypothetical protein [Bifidobacteriaceae bacterium]